MYGHQINFSFHSSRGVAQSPGIYVSIIISKFLSRFTCVIKPPIQAGDLKFTLSKYMIVRPYLPGFIERLMFVWPVKTERHFFITFGLRFPVATKT